MSDDLAERLLQVIDEGRRTATYKLALLLALIDACASNTGADGRAPRVLHTREIARHVLRIYLPQVRDYPGVDGDPLRLRHITSGRSPAIGAVLELNILGEQRQCRTAADIERRLPAEYERCLDEVERTFARYPLRLLQVVGARSRPFLYDIDWGESVSLKRLHAEGGGQVVFRPGVGDDLLRLAPLIRPLVELHWTRMVARINRIATEDERLHAHLFGVERAAFPAALRAGLVEMQGAVCFYCGGRLANRTQVDHFIPWARWPNDAVENLVVADSCNNHKRDYLAAPIHVETWTRRLESRAVDLAHVATESRWQSDPVRSIALVRTCYAHIPAGTPLWVRAGEFTDEYAIEMKARLADLRAARERYAPHLPEPSAAVPDVRA